MSAWTYVEGTLCVSKESHFSLKEAIKEHFHDHEAVPRIVSTKITPEQLTLHSFEFSYSVENEMAYNLWKKFVDHIDKRLIRNHSRVGMDCVVSIRWILS